MSATGIYSHRMEGFDDEFEGVLEDGTGSAYWKFMAGLIQDWEQAFYSSPVPQTRKVLIRMSFLMSAGSKSFFGICSRLTKKGLGGSLAGGEHFISWIHEKDLIAGIDFLLKTPAIESPVNFSSPHPVRQKDLMKILRKQWKTPFGLPLSKGLLKTMSFFTGIPAGLLLKSLKVYPAKLLKHGFKFQYPDWEPASRDLVKRFQKL